MLGNVFGAVATNGEGRIEYVRSICCVNSIRLHVSPTHAFNQASVGGKV